MSNEESTKINKSSDDEKELFFKPAEEVILQFKNVKPPNFKIEKKEYYYR